jgi:iron-sulfur cluster repair protein YtfE (RIC family)
MVMANQEISVNIPQTLDPVYSNMIQIAFKEDEFTFVFLHQLPGVNQARAKAIVSITPTHAKNLLAVLEKTMNDYESKFGRIEPKGGNVPADSVTTIRGYS